MVTMKLQNQKFLSLHQSWGTTKLYAILLLHNSASTCNKTYIMCYLTVLVIFFLFAYCKIFFSTSDDMLVFSEDAVSISKVCCTFWSPGESLKLGGLVNSFVISAFCYSLYINPAIAPDVSKSHYFFANIDVLIYIFTLYNFCTSFK